VKRLIALAVLLALVTVGCGGHKSAHDCVQAVDDATAAQLRADIPPSQLVAPANVTTVCVLDPYGNRSYYDRFAEQAMFYAWLDSATRRGTPAYDYMQAPERVILRERVITKVKIIKVKEAAPKAPTTKPPAAPKATTPVTYEPAVTGDGKKTVNPPGPTTATTRPTTATTRKQPSSPPTTQQKPPSRTPAPPATTRRK
jgi:hypothetical protein